MGENCEKWGRSRKRVILRLLRPEISGGAQSESQSTGNNIAMLRACSLAEIVADIWQAARSAVSVNSCRRVKCDAIFTV
jgi:hypothetical protein